MNIYDPTTWLVIANHPSFDGGEFDPTWYDGNMESDLEMLRSAAITILLQDPDNVCELVVLDDCTMYVKITKNTSLICSIYPSQTDDSKRCYFIDVEGKDEEIRVESVDEVLDILKRC